MNIEMIYRLFFSRFGVISDAAYFSSFSGLYNDNPLYISEQLHRINPNIKIYWLVKDKSKEVNNLPEYIHVIKKNGLKNAYYSSRAKVVVDNGLGLVYAFVDKKVAWLYKLLINKKQIDISTWHGTPLKRIGYDEYHINNDLEFITTSSLLVLGNNYIEEKIKNAFTTSLPIYSFGTPRNDILVKAKSKQEIDLTKKQLDLPLNKKIVLYAPTFRDHLLSDSNPEKFDYLMGLNIDKVMEALKKRFGEEWVFVFRGHQFVDKYFDWEVYGNKKGLINGNKHDDMAKYLMCCDVLITDYSASLFDFAITSKPCFLYCPDIDYYTNNERGLYDSIFELPYVINSSNEALINTIQSFNERLYKDKLAVFISKFGFCEEGNASSLTAELINDIIK